MERFPNSETFAIRLSLFLLDEGAGRAVVSATLRPVWSSRAFPFGEPPLRFQLVESGPSLKEAISGSSFLRLS